MTRRIAFSILIIVWLALLAAGASTYFITRAALIVDLDDTILGRVASLPELERPASLPDSPPDAADRVVIKNAQGRVLGPQGAPSLSTAPSPVILSASFSSISDGFRLRTLTIQAYARRAEPGDRLEPVTVIYSASAQRVDSLLRNLLYSLAAFGVLAAVGTTLVAHFVAKTALKPLRDTVDSIGAIDEKTLDRRMDVKKLPVELLPMGLRLNELLARLEVAFQQRRQFLGDASHELRTPVAALVTTLQVALRKRRDASDYVNILERCLTDAQLLNQLVESLLEQVRSEQFVSAPELTPVSLYAALEQCASIAGALGRPRGIVIRRVIPTDLVVLTDEIKLRSMVINLLSNAVEYAPERGLIILTAATEPAVYPLPSVYLDSLPDATAALPAQLMISVQDDGPGIAARHLPNLFEPFYRAESAHSLQKHLGLGLALVRAYARALGGDCTVRSPSILHPSPHGSAFTLRLPTRDLRFTQSTTENRSPEMNVPEEIKAL